MRKKKAFLVVVTAGVLLFGGYFAAKQAGLIHTSPQLEEPPKLAEGLEEGSGNSGGELEGDAPGAGNSGEISVPDEPGGEEGGNGAGNGGGADKPEKDPTEKPSKGDKPGEGEGISRGENGAIAVIAQPASVTALVNPYNKLPEDYEPDDLDYPNVKFIFSDKVEKRMLREEAARALEKLFSGAEADGIYLAGVSAYRSHATQTKLFDRYVKRDGYEKARTYSALPGTSEHETGLAIDVTSSDGSCAAADCFGDTEEAAWLAANAVKFGFIVRYPEGKDKITGYQYEPWHLRYVGDDLAEELASGGLTLEEYYNAVPVAK
ncbi:M15 family metallopeptidase [Paenibacillus sp. LHD-117]|uniref:M15 family metallopeptidase n=1 Tax=Paenibacillus sp. LHD-117 TaxID=3071412 RepID=UPI0027DF0B23|nr:M15 family metallopeptidase [Paenibacillus sp. LHD-117]MDQ6420149.1 M15 family metallopeptidase [Paenibacillus sp. LHD-117]